MERYHPLHPRRERRLAVTAPPGPQVFKASAHVRYPDTLCAVQRVPEIYPQKSGGELCAAVRLQYPETLRAMPGLREDLLERDPSETNHKTFAGSHHSTPFAAEENWE